MPTYEYECTRGHQFEADQRISDPPLARCRVCRAKARRLISRTSFVLKGGGWYADGYGAGKKNGGGAAPESKSSESKSGESKPESKSEAKEAKASAASKESSTGTSSTPSKSATTPDSTR